MGAVLTLGVDLAAEPAGTAIAAIRWSDDTAAVEAVQVGVDDVALLAAVGSADKAGIDCPIGWPAPFVEFLQAHHSGRFASPDDIAGRAGRRRLAYRLTDLVTHAQTGQLPLSVAADRIGHTAMRCAALLARLAAAGAPVDRCGDGVVVEVYPAASLRGWGLPFKGYKGVANRPVLDDLVTALLRAAPWLSPGAFEAVCRRSDHAFDAVVAALTARAAATGRASRPDAAQAGTARAEGWIALPTCPLEGLRPGTGQSQP